MTRLASACVVVLAALAACVPPLPGALDEATSGAGGAAPQTCSPACTTKPGCTAGAVTPALVAGFDSGCAVVERIDSRDGTWSLYEGTSGAVFPNPIPISCQMAAGCYSACLRGALTRSAVLAATLRASGAPYDASRYRGVAFFALGVLGRAQLLFRVTYESGDPFVAEVPGFSPMTSHRLYFERVEIAFPTDTPLTSLQWELATSDGRALDDQSTICLDQIELLPR